MWTNTLTTSEVDFTTHAMGKLQSTDWAQPLLAGIEKNGGLCKKTKPLLFEARYAFALIGKTAQIKYEFDTGLGSIDFLVETANRWLIEIVSLTESAAIKKATRTDGAFSSMSLSSSNPDKRQSEEGEYIKAQERICNKVYKNGKAHKFPLPDGSSFNVIVVDCRGFNGGSSDTDDYKYLANGAAGVNHNPHLVRYWAGEPIKGLYEINNPLRGSAFIRKRIHYLCFVNEEEYTKGEIERIAYYLPNPHLIKDNDAHINLHGSFPLKILLPK